MSQNMKVATSKSKTLHSNFIQSNQVTSSLKEKQVHPKELFSASIVDRKH